MFMDGKKTNDGLKRWRMDGWTDTVSTRVEEMRRKEYFCRCSRTNPFLFYHFTSFSLCTTKESLYIRWHSCSAKQAAIEKNRSCQGQRLPNSRIDKKKTMLPFNSAPLQALVQCLLAQQHL
ncbi:hypothetical protein IF1G_02745 [Cordyceps javanica]|uniref:Uncharacterized protein n=1 Tax=Cordyceps javanica TaxID=43265 RepID=A0A545VAB4_9HYPO|nr:hypothetical protein IF1G_02745 [Cordyceps javanica]